MININIEKFKILLLKTFPEFANTVETHDIEPFILFGDFGLYIRSILDNEICNEAEINKIFSFLNEMGNSTDEQVHNLLTVGILEIITDSYNATSIAKINLEGEALKDLELIQNFWNNNSA